MTDNQQKHIYISYAGHSLLTTSLLNKDTAFTEQERRDFNLIGLIPNHFETIEEQANRAYSQYCSFEHPINQHIYLRAIQDTNETLFYYLLEHHLEEMMPIIYTPTVGEACERFSEIYRRARGLFISYPDRYRIDEILNNATKHHVKVIVVTDGSRILGLGDQGVGGIGIPIGKLSLYTACAGISPAYTLPIVLDVGTNNETLLNDSMYIGWHHKRINDEQYEEFMTLFIEALERRWPGVLLQFEDFEQKKAEPLLTKYRDQICCFNDDIQGTAAITSGSLIAACHAKNSRLSEQTIMFVGGGSAGCGIAEQLIRHMCREGLSEQQARERIFIVDRYGLLTNDMDNLLPFQQKLTQDIATVGDWPNDGQGISLQTVVEFAKPSILIGVSGQPGLFTEQMIKTMHQHCEQPIIFPLSNPSHKVEATPEQLMTWTDGKALVATGSPFEPVEIGGKQHIISQCNNSYIFPGIGLAVVAGGVSRITDEMMMIAGEILASYSPLAKAGEGALLPSLDLIDVISKDIAFSLSKEGQRVNVAPQVSDEALQAKIDRQFWRPRYREYRRVTS